MSRLGQSWLICSVVLLTCAGLAIAASAQFDGKNLRIPAGTDRWPTIGVTKALQYEGDGGDTFNSVRMDPTSFEAYVKTGRFAVGTMLELEIRRPATDIEPARGGSFQGAVLGRSMHVKDEKNGPGTWTFYAYENDRGVGTPIARDRDCYSCHAKHAKFDDVFIQFYPLLTEARQEWLRKRTSTQ